MLPHHLAGMALPIQIEGGANGETTPLNLIQAEDSGQFPLGPFREVGRRTGKVLGFRRRQVEGGGIGLLLFFLGDKARFPHVPEDRTPLLLRQIGIDQRGIDGGRRGETGNEGRLRQGQLLGALGEIHPGRIRGAIGVGSQIDVIDVLLKNSLLAELTFQLEGQKRFFHLANQGCLLTQKHHPGQLLGDGASPFPNPPLLHVADQRPGYPPAVNTAMLVKTAILGGNKGLPDLFRNLAGGDFISGNRTLLLDDLPIQVHKSDGLGPVKAAQPPHVRQLGIHDINRCCQADSPQNSEGQGHGCSSAQLMMPGRSGVRHAKRSRAADRSRNRERNPRPGPACCAPVPQH